MLCVKMSLIKTVVIVTELFSIIRLQSQGGRGEKKRMKKFEGLGHFRWVDRDLIEGLCYCMKQQAWLIPKEQLMTLENSISE